jgi:hypothetical protein
MQLMSASMALAGLTATGCRRWPEEKIVPSTVGLRNSMPGVAEFYATTFERNGIADALLVTSMDGRPIKIEGNDSHPTSGGRSSAFVQASILDLYDQAEGFTAVDQATASTSAEVLAEKARAEAWRSEYASHVPLPDAVKAIYMSQCVVGTPGFRNDLVQLIDETELNAVIIDLKDYTGKLAFDSGHPDLAESVSDECGARDMKDFVATLHDKGIYVIGRITVFQDPYYSLKHPELAVKFASPAGAVWKDHKGLSFIDVDAKPKS